ncbi:MAG: type II toxin-antitoxin system Phd/YefM family antitoxin [Alphaproteobacteria bacterium]|nr:type II toxin-antitoxin system Phd/YefM family antitoxin [Alphaproteobacteria bacterium]
MNDSSRTPAEGYADAGDGRSMTRAVERVRRDRSRIVVRRKRRPVAVLIPIAELKALERLEDLIDAAEGQAAYEEFVRSGEVGIPFEKVMEEFGLKSRRRRGVSR